MKPGQWVMTPTRVVDALWVAYFAQIMRSAALLTESDNFRAITTLAALLSGIWLIIAIFTAPRFPTREDH